MTDYTSRYAREQLFSASVPAQDQQQAALLKFLKMGNKLFAIPWEALQADTVNKQFVLNVDKSLLENAPGFDKDNWPDMADLTFGTNLYRHYGYEPYWEDVAGAKRCKGFVSELHRSSSSIFM